MSELRVDNIVSQDGSAAPIYSKGLNIGAGVTLTNNGDYVVGGATSIAGSVTSSSTGVVALAGGVTVAGVTTVSNTLNVTGSQTVGGALTVTGNQTVTGRLDVTGGGTLNTTGILTCGTLDVSGSTSFGDITGTISQLVVTNGGNVGGALTVGGNLTVNGTTTTIDTAVTSVDSLAVDGEITTGGKPVATTGKAIAMAMVFGG